MNYNDLAEIILSTLREVDTGRLNVDHLTKLVSNFTNQISIMANISNSEWKCHYIDSNTGKICDSDLDLFIVSGEAFLKCKKDPDNHKVKLA